MELRNEILYDSYDGQSMSDEDWEEIAELNGYDKDDESIREECCYEEQRWLWEDLLERLENQKGKCVVTGYFMAWNGKVPGGLIRDSLKQTVETIIMDDSHVTIAYEEGELVMHETHHDAPCSGNYYVFKIMTEKGEKWYEKNKERLTKDELCEGLTNTKGYCRNPEI